MTVQADLRHARHLSTIMALLWTALVIYGSLLPFEFTPQPISSAWIQFRAMPVLNVGPGSRADWLANLLLYVPLAFLWLGAIDSDVSRTGAIVKAILIVVALGVLALALEFAQLFLPRTVSVNDLVAEFIGASIGAIVWLLGWRRAAGMLADFSVGGVATKRALGLAYVAAYVLLALFPFDFVLSWAEFQQLDRAQHVSWWIAARGCQRAVQCKAQLVAEGFFAVPIGLTLILFRGRSIAFPTLLVLSVSIAGALEGAQLLLLSGVAQGASVAMKTLGILAGGLIGTRAGSLLLRFVDSRARLPVLALLAVFYVLAVGMALGFASGNSIAWPDAVARLATVRWIPFYNYYYTSEARAMASVVLQAVVYLPAGVLVALGLGSLGGPIGGIVAAAASGLLAIAVQISRLLHPPQRPDPTDVAIAMTAGVVAFWLVRRVIHLCREPGIVVCGGEAGGAEAPSRSSRWIVKLAYIPVFLAVCVSIATFPIGRAVLAAGILVIWAMILRWPRSWLVILLALLPAVDLAPWSGRYYFDEFDLLMLVIGGTVLQSQARSEISWPGWLAALFGIFALLGLWAMTRAVVPWPSADLANLAGYQSPLNSIRVGRGLFWSLLVLWLITRDGDEAGRDGTRFSLGMTIGLLGVGLVVLWERIVFTGPFNFQTDYRVAGPFSAISTAGAQIESYLAAAIPFAMLATKQGFRRIVGCVGIAALLLALHAVVATASRMAYLAVLVSAIPMSMALLWSSSVSRRMVVLLSCIAVSGFTLASFVSTTFVGKRLEAVQRDVEQRRGHWELVLDLLGRHDGASALGRGIGQYPPTFLWEAPPDRRPSTFAFQRADGRGWLRMGSGRVVFVGQFVSVSPGAAYTLTGKVRVQGQGKGVLNVALCDKWILFSFGDCRTTFVEVVGDGWSVFSRDLNATELGRGPPLFDRPVALAVYNGGLTTIDVTDVALTDSQGVNVVKNGDFTRGGDRWYFSADDHFPWNTFSLPLEILFEQGWVGLIVFFALVGAVLFYLAIATFRGDLLAAAFVSSILGFFVPAMFDGVIDDPRMRLLLMLLLCGSVLMTKGRRLRTNTGSALRQ